MFLWPPRLAQAWYWHGRAEGSGNATLTIPTATPAHTAGHAGPLGHASPPRPTHHRTHAHLSTVQSSIPPPPRRLLLHPGRPFSRTICLTPTGQNVLLDPCWKCNQKAHIYLTRDTLSSYVAPTACHRDSYSVSRYRHMGSCYCPLLFYAFLLRF